jgi:uncharacterized protein YggT (Ycf19 family)
MVISGLASFGFAGVAFAQNYGADDAAKVAGLDKFNNIPALIGNILGVALSFVGILFFILMLVGGIMWMTAHGNSSQTKKALDTIVAAIVGMVIVMGSYALTRFVFDAVNGNEPTGVSGTSVPSAQQYVQNSQNTNNGAVVVEEDSQNTNIVSQKYYVCSISYAGETTNECTYVRALNLGDADSLCTQEFLNAYEGDRDQNNYSNRIVGSGAEERSDLALTWSNNNCVQL